MSQRKSDVLNILLSYDLSRSLEGCASSSQLLGSIV